MNNQGEHYAKTFGLHQYVNMELDVVSNIIKIAVQINFSCQLFSICCGLTRTIMMRIPDS